MDTLAVQTLIGNQGSKAASILTGKYDSIVSIGRKAYGINKSGIHLLSAVDSGGTVTFASTDFGVSNPKEIRFIDISVFTKAAFDILLLADEQVSKSYTVLPDRVGIQRIRVPVSSFEQGRYWELTVTSTAYFRIDDIQAVIIVRAKGHTGV